MSVNDQATEIRQGEELDRDKVQAFLLRHIEGLSSPIAIKQFPSGFSNLTYFIKAGERELVLRRQPHGTKAKTAHDMRQEFKVLSALHQHFPYCPRPLAFCEDEAVMGCGFYVLEHIQDIIIRRQAPPELSFGPTELRRLTQRLVEMMAELHALDYRAVGLESLGKPAGYVRRQVEGWSLCFRNARTPDVPGGEPIMAWLLDKMPPENASPSIIHNDFKLDKLVLDPADPLRIIGVLDWEMATLGDPLMDLACTLAYWAQADDPPNMQQITSMITNQPGCLTRAEAVALYGQRTGGSWIR